jgi:hypothetical protein
VEGRGGVGGGREGVREVGDEEQLSVEWVPMKVLIM